MSWALASGAFPRLNSRPKLSALSKPPCACSSPAGPSCLCFARSTRAITPSFHMGGGLDRRFYHLGLRLQTGSFATELRRQAVSSWCS